MHSFTIHESRNLKQARPKGQYVDLLRYTLATPSWDFMDDILSLSMSFVKLFKPDASLHEIQICYRSENWNLTSHLSRVEAIKFVTKPYLSETITLVVHQNVYHQNNTQYLYL